MPTENSISAWHLRLRPRRCTKKPRISPAPPDPITKLGDDVLVEILIRLPDPRSAARCKTVCKRWSSLIFSPSFNGLFVSRHHNRSPPPLFLPSADYKTSFLLNILPVPPELAACILVWDSFKDLVLCGIAEMDGPNGELGRTFFICNPFTELWVALPVAPRKSEGYSQKYSRLVCEPSKSIDLDNGQSSFVYSEYRFRVVCMYMLGQSINLDVFCSDSREWTSKVLVQNGFTTLRDPYFISWDGKLVWACRRVEAPSTPLLVDFDPFHPDIPPIYTQVSGLLSSRWNISVSQGAFYIFSLGGKGRNLHARVWRLEKDRQSWRHYEVRLKTISSYRNYDLKRFSVLGLHPANPEIVFLHYPCTELWSCNLSNGELDIIYISSPGLRIFQPTVSCWPTPIPMYKELRDMYDGSYFYWDQHGDQVRTPFKKVLDLVRKMRPEDYCRLQVIRSLYR